MHGAYDLSRTAEPRCRQQSDDYRLCHHLRRVSRHRPLPKTSTNTTMTTMISITSQMFM